MPAVLAFRRLPGGDIVVDVGEDADQNMEPDALVIRNIKRWALGSDPYVHGQLELHVEQANDRWPIWWDPDSRSIRLWNSTVTAEEAIRLILREALSRAKLNGTVAEWRTGCPVNSDLAYRKALISALANLRCSGRIQWIAEEPLLLVALGVEIGSLADGTYLVYDLGGGSFDCAIVEISGRQITVLSEEGLPTLGGMNVDEALRTRLAYQGADYLLRTAKETVSSGSKDTALFGGYRLTRRDVEAVLKEERFAEKTLASALYAYKKAKLLWKRPYGSSPIGEDLGEFGAGMVSSSGALAHRTSDRNGPAMRDGMRGVQSSGLRKSVWSLKNAEMAKDIDGVLLVGGSTQFPYFRDELAKVFGRKKIIATDDLVRLAGREDIYQAALTALSHGACYIYGERDKQYVPVTLDRIPASIRLKVTDGEPEVGDTYEAFQKLGYENPVTPYVGRWVAMPILSKRNVNRRYSFSVSIRSPDGVVLNAEVSHEMRLQSQSQVRPRADRARLIVDRLGRVWVELEAGMFAPRRERVLIADAPVWQTTYQQKKMLELYEEQREHEKRAKDRLHQNLTNNPFGWQSNVG